MTSGPEEREGTKEPRYLMKDVKKRECYKFPKSRQVLGCKFAGKNLSGSV